MQHCKFCGTSVGEFWCQFAFSPVSSFCQRRTWWPKFSFCFFLYGRSIILSLFIIIFPPLFLVTFTALVIFSSHCERRPHNFLVSLVNQGIQFKNDTPCCDVKLNGNAPFGVYWKPRLRASAEEVAIRGCTGVRWLGPEPYLNIQSSTIHYVNKGIGTHRSITVLNCLVKFKQQTSNRN